VWGGEPARAWRSRSHAFLGPLLGLAGH